MRLPGLLFGALLLLGLSLQPACADKRVALVIGNSTYRNVARLDNPANDAKLLADTLFGLGFTLVGGGPQLDLDKASLDRAVQTFGAQLTGADVGLFYYAGHGVQVRGENYLVPVEANPTKEADVDFQMLDTNLVLRQMEGAGTRLNIVILDACRNNPFAGRGLAVDRARESENTRLRDIIGGLAQMQAPEGTLISFATQPGSVAQDGAGGNSPYARALALVMRRPGLDIFQTFNEVGLTVKRTTRGLQLPWVSTSPIDGNFYFVAPPPSPVANATPVSPQPASPSADDIQWGILKDASDIGLLRHFIEMNPGSRHRAEAEQRIAGLTGLPAPAVGPPAGAQTAATGRPATAEPIDRREMTRSLQAELKRVGCFEGAVDGEFSNATRTALRKFAKLAAVGMADEDISPEVLKAVRGVGTRVCPLLCQADERADGDRCIHSTCSSGQVLKNGTCVATPSAEHQKRATAGSGSSPAAANHPAAATEPKGNGKCFSFQGRQFCE
jgi:uncharacterized caspase-like protein